MKVSIRKANIRDACFIAASMREQDFREIDAVHPIANPSQLACLAVEGAGDLAFIAYLHDQPVTLFGVSPMLPHVGQGWAFGTDAMRRTVPAMTRHGLNVIVPTLRVRGYHRIEVRTYIGHDLSHKWLRGMGSCHEGICHRYGRNGEDFALYALTF